MRAHTILISAWLLNVVAIVLTQGLDPITDMCIRFDQQSVTKNQTLYIDGGRQTFATVVNGSTPAGNITTGYNNYLITIDLSQSWDWKTNITESALNKTAVPATGTLPPVVARGAMWPGQDEDDNIYLWGGTTSYMNTSFPGFQNPYPATYSLWSYNIVNKTWGQYDVTDGSPNRPSSGSSTYSKDSALGFYFNGQLDSGSSQETQDLGDSAKVFLEGMIVVDTNKRTAQNVSTAAVVGNLPRTRGRMIYVSNHVAENGILVQIGGNQKPVNETANTYVGDLIPMDTIDIFDISTLYNPSSNSTSGWYRQSATGDVPPGRLDFCLIYASAPDHSSHNIYLYGGRGVNDAVYDDVYVLSIPSFTWIKMYNGTSPRYGHSCHRAGRSSEGRSMITVGGAANYDYTKGPCDSERMGVGVYDMSTSSWSSFYDADAEDYTVPDAVVQRIGGTKDGGATKKVPSYGFSQQGVAKLFGAPSSSVNDTNLSPSPTTSTNPAPRRRSHPSRTHIAIIAVATVGGTLLLCVLAALCYFYRHRIHRLATGGPFLPPEVDGKDNIVHEAMAKEIFVELPGETRRVELEQPARVEIHSSSERGSSRRNSSRTERRPPMYPWNWI